MNPLAVRIFDINRRIVSSQLLDMCLTRGRNAECMFNKINEVMETNDIPWLNCVGFSVDNTSTNLGKHNSIKSPAVLMNTETYFMGCPCHIVHNTAEKGSKAFAEVSKLDMEDLLIYYWFDKSTQRKSGLEEYCVFCDVEYRKILKHVSTRWLSLETAIDRILKQYAGLQSYFKSEELRDARFQRLEASFTNPMTEVYLLFFPSVLPVFTHFNLFMQREDPCLFLLPTQMENFKKKLFGKFVKMDAFRGKPVDEVNFANEENQLPDSSLFIGFTARQRLLQLGRDEISPYQKKFLDAVRAFYTAVCEYALCKLPWNDPVLQNSIFVDFKVKDSCDFSTVQSFALKYDSYFTFSASDMGHLQEEYEYQLLQDDDIPADIWQEALVRIKNVDGEEIHYHRMDKIWGYLAQCKRADGGSYLTLTKVAQAVLVLPHSNASEERVFSMVTKNKTIFRPTLRLSFVYSESETVSPRTGDTEAFSGTCAFC